ncbi:hypothetical protein [Rosistilla oblonga]|uniref:hypothetical protein n=1 Tax=Rosistilla oblonga TaxID=2527990 RepID=UPI003A979B96
MLDLAGSEHQATANACAIDPVGKPPTWTSHCPNLAHAKQNYTYSSEFQQKTVRGVTILPAT